MRDVTSPGTGAKLTRFDTEILTVQPAGDGWTVVITEKLEFELQSAEGEPRKACSFWVTRDGCRQEGDRWLVTKSEAIGVVSWTPGTKPPFTDW